MFARARDISEMRFTGGARTPSAGALRRPFLWRQGGSGPSRAHQAEAEVAGGRAGPAAARAGIADKLGDKRAVASLGQPHPAVDDVGEDLSFGVEARAHKTAVGPFPDVARHIEEPVLVAAKRA